MLITPLQTERTVNTRFFTNVRMLFLRVDFKLPPLCCFSMRGERQIIFLFLLLRRTAGRGTETKRWHSPVFLVFIEARTCD